MELYFSSSYDKSDLFILQVPHSLLEDIEKNEELIIKGSNPTLLCSKDKGYELKMLETSNTLLLLKDKENYEDKKDIILKTDHCIEATNILPKKYYIYNLLKKFCLLNYDISTGQNNINSFKQIYSLEELFAMCDLPSKQFNELILETHIFKYNEEISCIFDFQFIINFISDLLKGISITNKIFFDKIDNAITLLPADSKFKNVINSMNESEKRNIIEYIADISENDSVNLNVNKIKFLLAKSLFYSNKDGTKSELKLSNFILLFNNVFAIYLPVDLSLEESKKMNEYLSTTNCEDNLYERYKEYDLRFLIGKCIIYQNKSYNEPLIKWIDISELSEKFEDRITELFGIKNIWTMKEICYFLNDLELPNLQDRILRLTRPIQEDNLFDKTKKNAAIYLKINPYFKKK